MTGSIRTPKASITLLALAAMLLYPATPVQAAQVSLAWDAPTENSDGTPITALAGYILAYGTASGQYTQSDDVGSATTTTLSGLAEGQVYYAVVKAYNSYGVTSDFSTELSWTMPDESAPSISLPAELRVAANTSGQATIPDVTTLAIVSDNLTATESIILTQDPTAGTLVGLGVTAVTVTATDAAGNSASAVISVVVEAQNRPPVVSAGSSTMIRLPENMVTLSGSVTDDGLPAGSTISTTWSLVSGPASVTFGNASMAETTATFSLAGDYVLRLTATDGLLSANAEVTITVKPTPAPKAPQNLRTSLAKK